MYKKLISMMIAFAFTLGGNAQSLCTAYLPAEGTKLTYINYDKKGKETSTSTTKVTSVETRNDTTYFKVHQLISTGKEKDNMENDLVYKCSGDVFVVDMNTFLNQEMMEAYQGSTMTVTTNHLVIPGNLEPGMELEDGEIEIVARIEPIITSISARLFYREVESVEEITVPAGTFTAYKIKGYVESKIGFMRLAYGTTEWYVPDIGVVKSETYNKKNKLMGSTELQAIQR